MESESASPPSAVLRPRDAANYIGLSLATLARMRVDGSGPVWHQLKGRTIAYDRAELDAWRASRPKYRSTSERSAALAVA